jgi:hypothetical protein
MKKLALRSSTLAFAIFFAAKSAWAQNGNRIFMPKNSVRGFVEFALAPPHNEIDLSRCLAGSGQYGGKNAPCSAFARYMAAGYLELHPFGRGPLSRLFFFAQPNLFLGDNIPQFKYTYSTQSIMLERSLGIGIELPKNFELRLTHHRNPWLGKYKNYLGPADLGPNGPYGLYTTVSVRWRFGDWGRH